MEESNENTVETKSENNGDSKISITSIKSGSLLQTISELSNDLKQESSNISLVDQSYMNFEVIQYIDGKKIQL